MQESTMAETRVTRQSTRLLNQCAVKKLTNDLNDLTKINSSVQTNDKMTSNSSLLSNIKLEISIKEEQESANSESELSVEAQAQGQGQGQGHQSQFKGENEDEIEEEPKQVHPPSSLKEFQCDICLKFFALPSNLKKHRRVHSIERRYKCSQCNVSFRDKRSLDSHARSHQAQSEGQGVILAKPHKCDLCPKSFGFRQGLLRHILKAHVVDKSHECTICSRKFVDPESLEGHRRSHYRGSQYQCDICSRRFMVRKSLTRHLNTIHGKPFVCFLCWKSFEDLEEHDEHLLNKNPGKNSNTLQCPLCDSSFSSQCLLNQHTEGHLNQIQHQGEEEVPTFKNLNSNQNSNSGQFPCTLCPHLFDQKSHLTLHYRSCHPTPKKSNDFFKCPFPDCGKTFKFRYRLIRHEQCHSESRPFGCDKCDKKFLRHEDLKMHGIVHSKEKQFKCGVKDCGKGFHHMFDLKKHLAGVHKDQRFMTFKCETCGKGWASKSQLEEHKLSHVKERGFKCDLCDASFKHRRHVYGHKRKMHGVKEEIKEEKD